MPAFHYRCPHTRLTVRSWSAHDLAEYDDDEFEKVICNACRRAHLVNPKTGKVKAPRTKKNQTGTE